MNRARRRTAAGLLGALVCASLGSTPARAEPPQPDERRDQHAPAPASQHRVLLLPLMSQGLLPADHEGLEARIVPAFEHGDIELVTLKPATTSCADEACARALGRERGATHVVRVELVADGRDYDARVEVLTVGALSPWRTIDASCSICGLAELADRLAGRAVAARELILAAPRAGRVRVIGDPSNARLRIDGRRLGQLPYTGELTVGAHELVVTASGHVREVIPLEAMAGVEELVDVQLTPKPWPRWRRPVGWVATITGAASIGAGAAFINLDSRPPARRCSADAAGLIDGAGNCRWLHDTVGVGVGLTIAGIALATAGITLLAIDARQRRTRGLQAANPLAPQLHVGAGIGRLELQLQF